MSARGSGRYFGSTRARSVSTSRFSASGVVQRSHKDSQKLADLKKCDPLEPLKKGDKKTFTGEFKHKEQASWMLLNDSKKVARAKVKFHATPQ